MSVTRVAETVCPWNLDLAGSMTPVGIPSQGNERGARHFFADQLACLASTTQYMHHHSSSAKNLEVECLVLACFTLIVSLQMT